MSKLQESSAQGQMSRSRACSSLRRRNCPALMPFHFAGKHQEKVILWPMVDLEPVFSCFVDAQGKQAQQDSCTHSTQESIVYLPEIGHSQHQNVYKCQCLKMFKVFVSTQGVFPLTTTLVGFPEIRQVEKRPHTPWATSLAEAMMDYTFKPSPYWANMS